MHHRGYSVFGPDRRQIRRADVVSRGQPWSIWLAGLIPAGRGSKGLGRPCAGVGLPVIPFANFRRAKKLGFAPLLKMPKDWLQGSQAAFSGCGVGDGMCEGGITRCRASERFCAADGCGWKNSGV